MWYAKRVGAYWAIAPYNNGGKLRATTKRKLLNLIMTNILSIRDLFSKGHVACTVDTFDGFAEIGFAKLAPATYGVVFARYYMER